MKELKDYTIQELRGELNRRLRLNRIPSGDRPRCKTCKYCVSATTLAKMIKNKEIDTNMPFYLAGHYCLLNRNGWGKEENEHIFDWTKKICDKYENKKL